MSVARAFGMFWVITVQLPVTVETDRDKVVFLAVGCISIYVMNLDICRTNFATKAAMASAPEKELGSCFFQNRDLPTFPHFITSLRS